MKKLFRGVFGFEPVYEVKDFSVFEFRNGDKLEIFGPNGPDPSYQFGKNRVISGFMVDDTDEAISNARGLGLKILGDGGEDGKGYRWQHFEMPDGTVWEFNSE